MKITTTTLLYPLMLAGFLNIHSREDHTQQLTPTQLSLDEALEAIPANGQRYAQMLKHGTMSVLIYAPRGRDDQQPHQRDELYIVMKGRGKFINSGVQSEFKPGDVLFVKAGAKHRFEDFSEDLAVWVVFYGKEGGESE
jgi:mannose-6-phosphate isomerase-like protein (cupin superfamily)